MLLLLIFEGVDGGVFFNTVAILLTVFMARELTVSMVPLPAGEIETGTAFGLVLALLAGVRLVVVIFGVEPIEVPFAGAVLLGIAKPVVKLAEDLVLLRVAIPWLVSGVDDLWLDDFVDLTLCIRGRTGTATIDVFGLGGVVASSMGTTLEHEVLLSLSVSLLEAVVVLVVVEAVVDFLRAVSVPPVLGWDLLDLVSDGVVDLMLCARG